MCIFFVDFLNSLEIYIVFSIERMLSQYLYCWMDSKGY